MERQRGLTIGVKRSCSVVGQRGGGDWSSIHTVLLAGTIDTNTLVQVTSMTRLFSLVPINVSFLFVSMYMDNYTPIPAPFRPFPVLAPWLKVSLCGWGKGRTCVSI